MGSIPGKYFQVGCSTAAVRTTHEQEVVGSNPIRFWTFLSSLSFFLHLSIVCPLTDPSRRGSTTDFIVKDACKESVRKVYFKL